MGNKCANMVSDGVSDDICMLVHSRCEAESIKECAWGREDLSNDETLVQGLGNAIAQGFNIIEEQDYE